MRQEAEEAYLKRLEVLELSGRKYKMFIMLKEIKEGIKDRNKGQEAIKKNPTVFGKEPNKLL